MKLLREIIDLHQNDAEPTALIDADLTRLNFVHDKSALPEKDSLYLAALTQLQKKFANHEASAEITWNIAQLLNGDETEAIPYNEENAGQQAENQDKKWNIKKAVELCKEAISCFPESFGGKNCRALLESIQQPFLSVTISNAVPVQKPALALVSYRNTPKVYFRLLKMDPATERDLREKDDDTRFSGYLKLKSAMAWEQPLPDDGDYREHSAEVKIPAMAAGYYVLLASNNPEFPKKSAVVVSANFWCSNISYITCNNDANKDVMVLNRETGQPLSGITVQPFFREYSPKTRKMEITAGEKLQTDKNGTIIIKANTDLRENRNYYLEFRTKSDYLFTDEYFSSYYFPKQEPQPITQTHFFTDRAIYRPGQTVYFKGIVLEKEGNNVKIKPNYSILKFHLV